MFLVLGWSLRPGVDTSSVDSCRSMDGFGDVRGFALHGAALSSPCTGGT